LQHKSCDIPVNEHIRVCAGGDVMDEILHRGRLVMVEKLHQKIAAAAMG